MSDNCSICGRNYAAYSEGHTPNSQTCLENQCTDLLARVKELEVALEKCVVALNDTKHQQEWAKTHPGESWSCVWNKKVEDALATAATLERKDVEADGKRLIGIDEACDQPEGSFTKYVQDQERVESHRAHQRKDVE